MLAFPCNQFGNQEPGTNSEIRDYVREVYDVDFSLFAKCEVNGEKTNELWRYLRMNSSLHDSKSGQTGVIPWNFSKFIINTKYNSVEYFEPLDKVSVIGESIKRQVA